MKLIYEKNSDSFIFTCKPDQNRFPRNAGFEYDPEDHFWFTFSKENALKLMKYSANIDTKHVLNNTKKKINEKIKQSWSKFSDIEIPKPNNGMDYFPFQKASIEFALQRKCTLIADEMGLGKTIQSIGVLNKMTHDIGRPLNTLIITPSTMKDVWKNEVDKWLIDREKHTVTVNSGRDFTPANVMIVNFNPFGFVTNKNSKKFRDPNKGKYNPSLYLFEQLKKVKNIDLLIIDESHRLKNWSSNTTRNIFKLRKMISKDHGRAIFLTGTPVFKSPEEIWTTIRFFEMQEHFKRNKLDFLEHYSHARFDWRQKRMISGDPRNEKELQEKLRYHFMIRRRLAQVFEEMPEKLRTVVPVEVSDKRFEDFAHLQSKEYKLDDLDADGISRAITAMKASDIEDYSALRQICGEAKIKFAKSFIDELVEQGEKVIVFGYHKKVLMEYKELYPNSAMITGSTKQSDRIKEIERFQNDPKCKVFIGNLDAASVGITLTASSKVVFVELHVTPAIMEQAESRALRIGQTNTVNCYYLIAKDTLDAYIGNMLIEKLRFTDKALNKENLNIS